MKEEFHWNLSLQWPRRGGLKEIPQWWRTEDTQFCTPWSGVTSHLSTPPVSGISIQAVPLGLSSVSQARSEAHLATLMLCLMQNHCYDSTDFFLLFPWWHGILYMQISCLNYRLKCVKFLQVKICEIKQNITYHTMQLKNIAYLWNDISEILHIVKIWIVSDNFK